MALPAGYSASLNSSLYLATPDRPLMACTSTTRTMKAVSDTPSHWQERPCVEPRSKPNRG